MNRPRAYWGLAHALDPNNMALLPSEHPCAYCGRPLADHALALDSDPHNRDVWHLCHHQDSHAATWQTWRTEHPWCTPCQQCQQCHHPEHNTVATGRQGTSHGLIEAGERVTPSPATTDVLGRAQGF